jgi:hypothetical protein
LVTILGELLVFNKRKKKKTKMSSEIDEDDLPLDVLETARNTVSSLIPEKPSRQYESA